MKKIFLILLFLVLLNKSTYAITLSEALLTAYNNNSELNAERENIKISKEDLSISRSEFLPSVTLSGSKSEENTEKLTDRTGANASITDVNPKSRSVDIEQKLFQGFAGVADFQKNKIKQLITNMFDYNSSLPSDSGQSKSGAAGVVDTVKNAAKDIAEKATSQLANKLGSFDVSERKKEIINKIATTSFKGGNNHKRTSKRLHQRQRARKNKTHKQSQ